MNIHNKSGIPTPLDKLSSYILRLRQADSLTENKETNLAHKLNKMKMHEFTDVAPEK